mmetsp:Transcript_90978/g.195068  ORF Transcript_90978/g.195068 Transcript_90978/m.195068 type:complete len:213 (+) Transcript_90978:321-959(+)
MATCSVLNPWIASSLPLWSSAAHCLKCSSVSSGAPHVDPLLKVLLPPVATLALLPFALALAVELSFVIEGLFGLEMCPPTFKFTIFDFGRSVLSARYREASSLEPRPLAPITSLPPRGLELLTQPTGLLANFSRPNVLRPAFRPPPGTAGPPLSETPAATEALFDNLGVFCCWDSLLLLGESSAVGTVSPECPESLLVNLLLSSRLSEELES